MAHWGLHVLVAFLVFLIVVVLVDQQPRLREILFALLKMALFFLFCFSLYMFGMPLLSKAFAGFGADAMAPRAKNAESNAKLWDLSIEFCKENGVESCEAYNL